MAAPVISSVVATPSSIAPGQSAVVKITASDADSRQVTLSGSVSDASGDMAGPVTVALQIVDPLSYSLTAPAGSGLTITPLATPGEFQVSA